MGKSKDKLAVESNKLKYKDLERLFDTQIQTLRNLSCPEQIVRLFVAKKSSVLSKASKMAFENGHIPFIPVIPQRYRTLYDLIAMVRNGNEWGYTQLDPADITDKVKTPGRPYYIYDVEDGRAFLGKSPMDAEKILKKQLRSPLTTVEAIALTIHTDVLRHHYIKAAGSCYNKSDDGIPAIFLHGGMPVLGWGLVDTRDERWGSPFCGSRDL